MGRGPGGDAIDTVGELRNAPLQTTDEQLRRLALDARPDLQALRTDRARSVADLRLQLANGKVAYTVAGEYHRQEGSVIRGSSSPPSARSMKPCGAITRRERSTRKACTPSTPSPQGADGRDELTRSNCLSADAAGRGSLLSSTGRPGRGNPGDLHVDFDLSAAGL